MVSLELIRLAIPTTWDSGARVSEDEELLSYPSCSRIMNFRERLEVHTLNKVHRMLHR